MDHKDLLTLKQDIMDVKDEISRTEGRKEAILDQLSKDHGIKSIKAATKKVAELTAEINEWDNKIADATKQLEHKLTGREDSLAEDADGEGEGEEDSTRSRSPRTPRRTQR